MRFLSWTLSQFNFILLTFPDSPLPRDEVDVVPDGCVVFGPILRCGVAPGTLRFGRVGVRKTAQAHQGANDERCERHPRSEHVGHLKRAEKRQATISLCVRKDKVRQGSVSHRYKVFKKVHEVARSYAQVSQPGGKSRRSRVTE